MKYCWLGWLKLEKSFESDVQFALIDIGCKFN